MVLEQFFALPAGSVSDADRRAVLLASVNAMVESRNPYPIAERLVRFGSEAITPLSDLLTRNSSSEVNIVAVLILVTNGSRIGVPALVDEVKRGGDYMFPAAFVLANAGLHDHVPIIIEYLRRWPITPGREFPTSEDDRATTFLQVLNKLRVPFPDDILRKFADPQAPKFFRLAVERYHVGGSTS